MWRSYIPVTEDFIQVYVHFYLYACEAIFLKPIMQLIMVSMNYLKINQKSKNITEMKIIKYVMYTSLTVHKSLYQINNTNNAMMMGNISKLFREIHYCNPRSAWL